MTLLNTFFVYLGGITVVIAFLYGTKEYLFSAIVGFITFCIFYFSFGIDDFKWAISSLLINLKDAAVIYIISFAISMIIYKIFPSKNPVIINK